MATAQAQNYTNGNGTAVWSEDGNWSISPFPDNPNAAATITQNLTGASSISLDGSLIDLNSLTIGDSTSPFFGY